jgi:hypothetical protein
VLAVIIIVQGISWAIFVVTNFCIRNVV